MARRKVIFTTVLLFSCLGICLFVIELYSLNFCSFCHKRQNALFRFNVENDNDTFLLMPKVDCKKKPPFLVILVTTTYNQQEARMAIRQSWGKERRIGDKRVVTYFLLGTNAKKNKQEASTLAAESNLYKDIIQKNFIDVYYNLTIKTLMGVDWIYHYCSETSFVMKTDADVFINVFYLVHLISQKNQPTNFFTGFLKPDEYPIRNIFSKWYVNEYEYQQDKYPPFCSGTGYVFSSDVAQQIHNISASVPFLKLEDVFIGLCLDKLKIPLQELHAEQTFFPEKIAFSVCHYRKIVTSHGIQPHETLLYWKAMQRSQDEKCEGDPPVILM
ncbi:hypothetical protein FKM82_027259 [Ascaphus truei]